MQKKYKIDNFKVIVFDFDGVFTNNLALVDSDGKEYVLVNRADGLGVQFLKKKNLKLFIISSEKNKVVKMRSKKLNIECYYGVEDKVKILQQISKKINISLSKFIYVGNDINDLNAMKSCGLKLCPNDSHKEIKKISDIVLNTKGGGGITREIVEKIFKYNIKSF